MKALPKYAIGEVVILQSKERPEFNGEDTVIEIVYEDSISTDRLSGLPVRHKKFQYGKISYKLEKALVTITSNNGGDVEGVWAESALRKKQEPGEMSFMQLMSSLKIGEKV